MSFVCHLQAIQCRAVLIVISLSPKKRPTIRVSFAERDVIDHVCHSCVICRPFNVAPCLSVLVSLHKRDLQLEALLRKETSLMTCGIHVSSESHPCQGVHHQHICIRLVKNIRVDTDDIQMSHECHTS